MIASDVTDSPDPEERCSASEWRCQNGECINSDFVCDNTQDCVDGSDEDEAFCSPSETSPEPPERKYLLHA